MTRVIGKYMSLALALGTAVGMSLVSLGCSTIPARPTALEEARMAYAQVQQDPRVATYAPVALREAEEAVRRAELAWERNKNAREAENLAAVAKRRVEITRAEALKTMAEAEIGELSAERQRVLLEVRLREAERVQREADRAYQEVRVVTTRDTHLQQDLAAFKVYARETERGLVLTLENVLFDPNQATLAPGGMDRLATLATFLKAHPERRVSIAGYTDSMAATSSNVELSQRRAEAVQSFLIQHGIDPLRITATGYGAASPVASNKTESGRLHNQRVEVVIAY